MEAWLKDPFFFGEDILNTLHIFAGSWLDYLMLGITFLGNQMFYVIILPIAYWTWDKKTTIKIGVIFLISAAANSWLKDIWHNPRPNAANLLPGIKELNQAWLPRQSPGFPSGHTQGAVAFWGPVLYYIRKKPVIITAACLILLIPYSRLYLGVHYLGDVLGGFVIGLVILAAGRTSNSWFEKHWESISALVILITLTTLPLALLFMAPSKHLAQPLAVFSAMLCGAYLAHNRINFNPRGSLAAGLIKVIGGLVVIMIIKAGLKPLLPETPTGAYFRYWLIGFWVSFGAPLVFSKFELLRGKDIQEA